MEWIVSLKIMLMSSGVVFMALAMKVSVPLVLDFIASNLPLVWSTLISWLRPSYLFVIINGIIITIAASSRFYHNHPLSPPPEVSEDLDYEAKHAPEYGILKPPEEFELGEELAVRDVQAVVVNGTTADEEDEGEEEEEFVISRTDSSEILFPADKPPLTARFGRRKQLNSSHEAGGRALKVSRPKQHETLENTWKAITEGRSMKLGRHMKTCDTWEIRGRQMELGQMDPMPVKKSETFKDRTNQQAPSVTPSTAPGKLRKEPSLSQDELNRRVEAFINKFNEEMRLQRQESLNQYKEMINRGSHRS